LSFDWRYNKNSKDNFKIIILTLFI
jgi:hypothetical protein